MTSPNKPRDSAALLVSKVYYFLMDSSSSSGHRPSPTAVNNHTEEEDEDDLYEEPPDDDLEDKGEEEEEEEEGEDGLEGEGVGEDGAPARATGGPTSILTVTDNLLKNDGRKFLEMMEQLAELRLAHEEAVGSVSGDECMPFTAMFTQQQQPMSPRSLYVPPPYGFGPCLSSIHHQQQQGIPTPCGFPPMPANMGMVLVLWAN
ncbi:hypothetical protein B0H14DRAFT_3510274 [Mycena olivaceomarginata]|nr:hypothetical protein B0H14DRAFT_3510274 [Mycena olivaceomarginata]